MPNYPINLTGRKGIIAGWGKTEANLGQAGTNVLQVASVPIISKIPKVNIVTNNFFFKDAIDCVRWHESKQINVEIYNEMFCAGHSDGHQDACLGLIFF